MSFKILSLDGGGIRGVITARILNQIEQEIRKQGKGYYLNEYFDLIAGTSTGSILTAGIAVGKESYELMDLYVKKGKDIFPQSQKERYKIFPAPMRSILEVFSKPKYSHDGIIHTLKKEFGSSKIKDIEEPIILILAYDTLYRNTTFFTNCNPDLGARWYDDCYLWQLCVASASAPTFFPPYKLVPVDKEKFGNWEFPHIDGGVSANNPALAALSLVMRLSHSAILPEIKQKYKLDNVELEDISILSIGTGQTTDPYRFEEVKNWRGLNWAQNITDIFMDPTSEIASTMCLNIMGGNQSKRYLRLQFDLNERFQAEDGETYKDPRSVVEREKRKNQFTKQRVSEQIDNASEEFVRQLIDTASAFIEYGRSYSNRNETGPLVKDAIAAFIKNN
ncbi:patatin-like phospholipase family protein [Anabaena sphaerica FACHB-251]|uniref:Patatin-like phospholipase family protein n=1 Tax=Anabaena sphaerica FACHB-251 TaxID=2692883 RepID=A0A926WJT2_9NOST|nr:patatin-like phospholipase family protein [Anabaena sphaerica]MBD2295860.1 patatin-like phospholipase family protein [Anabaena sphaerica FACHB-251]